MASSQSDTRPLPEDTGAVHLYQLLSKLRTTARIMHTVAHPDDEDGGMLTMEARGKGATVLLFTVNRGEGGQNKVGTESSDDLGILRTLELLQAGKYYGVRQRFSHVVDFGFSKTAEETFNKWNGHDPALGDMVRAIRTFRPDVLISRFQGNKSDGHGNHEASGILTKEAFRAAGDPKRFPEQIAEGLLPWQPRKLYIRAGEDYSARLDTGTYSPLLGMSYVQFSLEGLAHQTSQGTGGIRVPPGHRFTAYKLVDAEPPLAAAKGHESDFLDGVDTSLVALAERVAGEEDKVPFLRPALVLLAHNIEHADGLFSVRDTSACAPPLIAGMEETEKLIQQIEASQLSPMAKASLLPSLRTKKEQFQDAANEALGLSFEVSADEAGPPPAPAFFRMEQTFTLATPGQTFMLTARLYSRGRVPLTAGPVRLEVPEGWTVTMVKDDQKVLHEGDNTAVRFEVKVPANAPYTRPYWRRSDPQKEALYTIDDPRLATLPFPPYPVHVVASFSTPYGPGEARGVAKVKFVDPVLGQSERPLAVGPPLSVLMESPVVVIPVKGEAKARLEVSVRSNLMEPVHGTLRLETPEGWKVEPAQIPVELNHDGDVNNYSFQVAPRNLREGAYQVTAQAEYNGRRYAEGFRLITRPDLDSFYAYHPAVQNVSAVDVALPAGLKIGYIMGAGDEIPSVLRSVGLNVSVLTPQELATGDLGRYDTIVVGIRSYDVRTDVREQNRRLLDYVHHGGTLLVQYNQTIGAFNEGHYTPYPATMGRERVSIEDQPVEILAPANRIFSYPNKIGPRDFDGWVQERGLYFMSQWDEHFQALLSSNDPGESPQKGGMLAAPYGKGMYLYCGYAFFRQLPAGVPGAIRLFVNLLSAGHTEGGA